MFVLAVLILARPNRTRAECLLTDSRLRLRHQPPLDDDDPHRSLAIAKLGAIETLSSVPLRLNSRHACVYLCGLPMWSTDICCVRAVLLELQRNAHAFATGAGAYAMDATRFKPSRECGGNALHRCPNANDIRGARTQLVRLKRMHRINAKTQQQHQQTNIGTTTDCQCANVMTGISQREAFRFTGRDNDDIIQPAHVVKVKRACTHPSPRLRCVRSTAFHSIRCHRYGLRDTMLVCIGGRERKRRLAV